MMIGLTGASVCLISGLAVGGDITGPQTKGPDVQVCRLYDLDQKFRDGALNGFSIATTSYNAGTENLDWFALPNENHPFITYNLYRMDDRSIEQIGVSWIKHGFAATNELTCTLYNGCNGPFGQILFPDCGDTYGSGLNASLTYLGPRYEVNPWTGEFEYDGSFLQGGAPPVTSLVDRLMIIHDQELQTGIDKGMTFLAEGYYVAADDVKHINNASYRAVGDPVFDPAPITSNNNGSGARNNYWDMSSSSQVSPTIGFAIEAWGGQTSLVHAPGATPKEGVSADGRSALSAKVFDNGDGTWDYEYVLLNIDMDAQAKSFTVPFSPGTVISSTGFHAPQHYETLNSTVAMGGVPIDSAPWTVDVQSDKIVFSTTSNPIRWGTAYNFRFTADQPPTNGDIEVEPFKSVADPVYTTTNRVPMPFMDTLCVADFDANGQVDLTDFGTFGTEFGRGLPGGGPACDAGNPCQADFDGNGQVDLTDFGTFGDEFGRGLPGGGPGC